jgi:hypothetical protein
MSDCFVSSWNETPDPERAAAKFRLLPRVLKPSHCVHVHIQADPGCLKLLELVDEV